MLIAAVVFGPMALALACYLIGRRSKPARNGFFVGACAAMLLLTLPLWRGAEFTWASFCGLGLHMRADGFRSLYATVAAFMWTLTAGISPEYFAHYHNRNRYTFFNLMTLGATLGVFFSDDLYTTLIFFEIMSLTSYTWVAHEETPGAMRAAGTYLAVAIIGGLTTLMGLFLLWHRLGTLSFEGMRAAIAAQGGPDGGITAAAWLTLFGFAAKAGMFPLHIWLPKAHPVAPAPASALLSGVLTKSGVFGVLVVAVRILPGDAAFGRLLLAFAVVTMFLGALLALFSIDLKRTLACSSVSQIGFISVGISMMVLLGEEGSLAAYGTLEHMVNHSLFKLCLFMCAGVVYMNLHRLNLNEIRGFGRGKWVLHAAFLAGAVSIACIPPLGSGFNSKSLLHEGILEYIGVLKETGQPWAVYKAVEILFIISGGLTIAYMTKLYVCLFWEKNPRMQEAYDGMNRVYITWPSAVVLLLSAAVMPALGLFGTKLMTPLAERSMPFFGQELTAHAVHYFTAENLIGALESIAVGAAVYLLVVRRLLMRRTADGHMEYIDCWPAWLDLENAVYRPLLSGLAAAFGAVFGWIAAIPDCRLVRVWIPHALGRVTAFVAAVPEGKAVTRWIPDAFTAITRALSELPERLVLLMRKTVFRIRLPKEAVPVGNRFTYGLGRLMDRVAARLNLTVRKDHPLRTDYEYVMDEANQDLEDKVDQVVRSVSFGQLLLAGAVLAILIYLLIQ